MVATLPVTSPCPTALAMQVQSKEEDEAIAKLQFAAHQKLTALEQDAAQQATLAKMRDEVRLGVLPTCMKACSWGPDGP